MPQLSTIPVRFSHALTPHYSAQLLKRLVYLTRRGRTICSTARRSTEVMELQAIKLLVSIYPGMIRRVTRGGSTYSADLDF